MTQSVITHYTYTYSNLLHLSWLEIWRVTHQSASHSLSLTPLTEVDDVQLVTHLPSNLLTNCNSLTQ